MIMSGTQLLRKLNAEKYSRKSRAPQHQVKALAIRRIPIGEAHAVTANIIARREEVVLALDEIGFRELGQPPALRLQGCVIDRAGYWIASGAVSTEATKIPSGVKWRAILSIRPGSLSAGMCSSTSHAVMQWNVIGVPLRSSHVKACS